MDTPVERVVADGLGGWLAILGRVLLPRLLLLLTLLVSFHLGVFGFLLLSPLVTSFLVFLRVSLGGDGKLEVSLQGIYLSSQHDDLSMLLGGRTILLVGHHEVVLGLGSLGEFLHGDWTPSRIIFSVMIVLVLDLLGELFARGQP
jgi:hypothetical protein